jgi:hypothetical protein
MKLNAPEIFDLPCIRDPRGNLSVLQYPSTMPFEPMRTYWIYDVPSGMVRNGHAYYSQQEVIVALSGSFDVVTDGTDGVHRFELNRAYQGLYLPPLTWRELDNFSTNAIALVISSALYDETDYIRDIDTYHEILSHGIR